MKSITCVISLILSVFFTHAHAKETVVWTLNDFIPFYIPSGPHKGQGISDKLTSFFQERLPQYNHIQEKMNFPRFFERAKRGELVCNPLLLKTREREKILSYSTAFKPAYAHILVSRTPIKYESGGLSFKEYLSSNDRPVIVQTKRSYGPVLDKVIKDARQNKRLKVHSFPTSQLFVMLENGRIDYFVDIENSATYYRSLHGGETMFFNIPLKEDRLNRFGYAVCTKSVSGQRLITRINDILKKEKASDEFRSILESWMAPENLARFRAFYDREILKN